jgi:hypothetical protein
MWGSDSPNISFGSSSGTVRRPAATRVALPNEIALRILGAKGVGGVARRAQFR